jgi:glycosyltransferase involved in cell wall biosynthesis
MYREKSVVVVVPAHNEETQIGKVLETMPACVDYIIIVDDASSDGTAQVAERFAQADSRITLLRHEKNRGVGAAIASGYKWARDHDCDLAAVMAGDGQMAPEELPSLLEPVASGRVDYAKGNRLFSGEAFKTIPTVRYFGNAALSLLTKIASGYWHLADSQSGYTVINKKALHTIDWDRMYCRYGQPNDLLVRLNVNNFRVCDVPIRPVYRVGEKSGMSVPTVIFTIGWLLVKLFFWRMKEKYVIRDFHPLVFFYALGFVLMGCSALLAEYLVIMFFVRGYLSQLTSLAFLFSFASGSQALFFAMWFDMECNRKLAG